jgi:hypothetical protein
MVKGHIDISEFSFGELDDLQVHFMFPFECTEKSNRENGKRLISDCSFFDDLNICLLDSNICYVMNGCPILKDS